MKRREAKQNLHEVKKKKHEARQIDESPISRRSRRVPQHKKNRARANTKSHAKTSHETKKTQGTLTTRQSIYQYRHATKYTRVHTVCLRDARYRPQSPFPLTRSPLGCCNYCLEFYPISHFFRCCSHVRRTRKAEQRVCLPRRKLLGYVPKFYLWVSPFLLRFPKLFSSFPFSCNLRCGLKIDRVASLAIRRRDGVSHATVFRV